MYKRNNPSSTMTLTTTTTPKLSLDTAVLIANAVLEFDLEIYINRYNPRSETRLQRLLHIASRTGDAYTTLRSMSHQPPNHPTSVSSEVLQSLANLCKLAYEMARDQMMVEQNISRYCQVFGSSSSYTRSSGGDDNHYNAGAGIHNSSSANSALQLQQQVESLSVVRDPTNARSAITDTNANTTVRNINSSSSMSADVLTPPAFLPIEDARRHFHIHQITCDEIWLHDTQQQHTTKADILENRLVSAKSSLSKESTRIAYIELGDFWKQSGMLKEALKCHLRTRDYCTNSKQSAQMCLAVIELGIDMRNFTHVNSYVNKAENTAHLVSNDPLIASKFRVASGLSALYANSYREAALKFTDASTTDQLTANEFDTVLSAEDIALYGSMLALASLDRDELSRTVLESVHFQQRLELLPWMRNALHHFSRAEYGPFLSILQSKRGEMLLDIHLSSHFDHIFDCIIHNRCLVQYFLPYHTVHLKHTAQSMNMTMEEVECAIERLISQKKLNARINILQNTVRAIPRVDHRVKSCQLVEERLDEVMAQIQGMLLRLGCLQSGVMVTKNGREILAGSASAVRRDTSGMCRKQQREQCHESSDDDKDDDDDDEDRMVMDPGVGDRAV